MKIDRLDAIHLRFEYPNRHGFRYAGGVCGARVTTLVAVHTDDGRVGYGSAYSHPGLLDVVLKQQLEPVLVGEDAADVERLWAQMYGLTRWYGRKGAVMTAIGGVDTALWDLRAQAAGQPLWKLLGGERPACPIYASGLLWDPPEALAREATGYVERGFRRMKLRAARGYDMDREIVRAVRRAIGPGHDQMVDGSMRYTVEEAREFARFLAEQRVFWFEEPFPPEDLASFKALRGTVDVPIAAGENEFGVQGFRELLADGGVDIAQPDVSRCGGVTETLRIAALAAEHGARVATHTWNDAVAILANAHVVSSLPHGVTVEVDMTGNPLITDLLAEPLRVRDGMLALPEAPGLGVRLNPATVERYRIDPYTQLADGLYSDMAFGKGVFRPAEAGESASTGAR
jgi:L-alanine-DL-glutamate epimerase-like enolase superfamily enzyme